MKKLVKIIAMNEWDARYDRKEALIGVTFNYYGDHYYKFANREDCAAYCEASGYSPDAVDGIFEDYFTFVGDETHHVEIDETKDFPIFKLVDFSKPDARGEWRHVMEGCEFYKNGEGMYSFVHKSDYLKYCEAREFVGKNFGNAMLFASGHTWEEVTKGVVEVKPEVTILKHGDVVHLKNIRVYHFIGENRAGGQLGKGEEIITDLRDIRLGLRPNDLAKWAKFAVSTGITFGKDW